MTDWEKRIEHRTEGFVEPGPQTTDVVCDLLEQLKAKAEFNDYKSINGWECVSQNSIPWEWERGVYDENKRLLPIIHALIETNRGLAEALAGYRLLIPKDNVCKADVALASAEQILKEVL